MSATGFRPTIDIDELKELANAKVAEIAAELLPNGRENCGYWEVGSIAGERGQSLKINLRGATRGLWTDFSAPRGTPEYSGNIIQLVAQVRYGGRVGDACSWLRSWLNLDHLDPERLATERATARKIAATAEDEARKKAEKNRARALRLFLEAAEYPGTIVEDYLCSRGLDFRKADLHAPGVLRFNPQTYCAETGTKLPAMVAAIHRLDGYQVGTHRTWLQPDGSGKATLVEAKKSIGKYQGGFIQLWKGDRKCPIRELPGDVPIYVSEGIEDGLSVALARPSLRVIAGISLSNIGSLVLPVANPIYILGQRDTKMQAIEAFESSVTRLQERGHEVFLIYPPEGVKDYNDLLRRDGAAQWGGEDEQR